MNKISKSNYEEFMIDYLDGTLSAEREAELLHFLDAHPEIKDEIQGLDEMVLSYEEPVFEFRDGLKKSILDCGKVNTDNFEEYCVALYENDLLEKEQEHLHNFVHGHPSLFSDFQFFAKLKLTANKEIQFANKANLQQFAVSTNETITKDNYIDFVIAQNEEDLLKDRALELQQFLDENPQYKIETKQLASLKLKVETSIVFENKSMLKRRAVPIPISNKWMNVAAASVAIMIVFYTFTPQEQAQNDLPIVSHIIQVNDSENSTQELSKMDNYPDDNQATESITPINTKHQQDSPSNAQQERDLSKIASVATLKCKDLEVSPELSLDSTVTIADVMRTVYTGVAMKKTANHDKEKTIELKGYAGKAVSRLSRLLGKSNRLEKKRIKNQLLNIADIAVAGINATRRNRAGADLRPHEGFVR